MTRTRRRLAAAAAAAAAAATMAPAPASAQAAPVVIAEPHVIPHGPGYAVLVYSGNVVEVEQGGGMSTFAGTCTVVGETVPSGVSMYVIPYCRLIDVTTGDYETFQPVNPVSPLWPPGPAYATVGLYTLPSGHKYKLCMTGAVNDLLYGSTWGPEICKPLA